MGNFWAFKHYFLSDKPYSSLKPAQDKERDYYSKATHEKPNGDAILANYTRFNTIYKENVSSNV